MGNENKKFPLAINMVSQEQQSDKEVIRKCSQFTRVGKTADPNGSRCYITVLLSVLQLMAVHAIK